MEKGDMKVGNQEKETIKRTRESINKKSERKVKFSFYAPAAKEVFLAGEFNGWNTQFLPMKKGKDGFWKTEIKLLPGRYEYKLFADHAWVEDIPGAEIVSNSFGTQNFIISVT
jgi:1,4-alpha-glucan branching enzyme